MRDRTTISLSTARANQLHEIATRKSMKVSDLIASWIIRDFEEHGEPSAYSDCEIVVHERSGAVSLEVELFQEHKVTMTPAQAGSLGNTFERVITAGADHKPGAHILDLDAGERGYQVGRRGAAVFFQDGAYRKTMPLGTAREIAKELQEAAEQYAR